MEIVIIYFAIGLAFSSGHQLKQFLGNRKAYEGILGENTIDIIAITFMWPLYCATSAYMFTNKLISHRLGRTEWNYHQGYWTYPGWHASCSSCTWMDKA